jgi:hypothetical protein
VHFSLGIKVNDVIESFNFYSSEIEDNSTIEVGDYQIQILSFKYKNSSTLLEMMAHRNNSLNRGTITL